ncbi:MAG: hypothetical protein GEU75_13015 [Dehalococcoidia bacterium]|nr:hypothetical protein [Dehalococcoidia bacterium]
MPKRARQAHIPKQQTTRRKPRRAVSAPETVADEAVYAAEPVFAAESEAPMTSPIATRTRRRLELVQRSRESVTPVRNVPGGLPTFERVYLMNELKTIGIISTVLLALILVLAVVLR